jgi:NAD(P)H-dependent FMN reductase
MIRIAIIIGSTRPGGKAKAVAEWVYKIAWQREDADFAEYNHGTSGALKNAIDFLYHEWRDKAAGFVGVAEAEKLAAAAHGVD